MNQETIIVFCVLVAAAILFVSNKLRSDIVALTVLLALMLTGTLSIEESLSGFSNPVVIILFTMLIVSEALVHTGIAQRIGEIVIKVGQGSETRLVAMLMLSVGVLGAFLNSSAAIAIFIPIALSVANKTGYRPKRLFMPLSVGALVSGMMTMIATAPNLVVNSTLKDMGLNPFGFFSFTPFGILILLACILFMLFIGRDMLADKKGGQTQNKFQSARRYISTYGLEGQVHSLRVLPNSPLVHRSVARIQITEKFDIKLIAFERYHSGKNVFIQASPEMVFQTGDALVMIGNPAQVANFAEAFQLGRLPLQREAKRKAFFQVIGVAEILLAPASKLIGKTFQESQFELLYKANVLGIRRRGKPITEGLHELKLDFGDAILVNAAWREIIKLHDQHENFVVLTLPAEFKEVIPARNRAPITLLTLIAMVTAMATGLLPNVTAALSACVVLIITRCVKLESVYRIINWQVIVFIAAILPLATALNKSGAVHIITATLVETLGPLNPIIMLSIIFAVTAGTGLFINNTATAVLIAPIAIDTALTIGVSPHAFAMTVAIACSAAYMTPISSTVNMLVLEPGGYGFKDFIKIGFPLLAITLIITVLLAQLFFMK